MPKSISALDRLLEKANQLPLSPGVYIMRDKQQKVIYVGKSRKLKNRVSQYFQNNKKNIKTARMVALIEDFAFIYFLSSWHNSFGRIIIRILPFNLT